MSIKVRYGPLSAANELSCYSTGMADMWHRLNVNHTPAEVESIIRKATNCSAAAKRAKSVPVTLARFSWDYPEKAK